MPSLDRFWSPFATSLLRLAILRMSGSRFPYSEARGAADRFLQETGTGSGLPDEWRNQ